MKHRELYKTHFWVRFAALIGLGICTLVLISCPGAIGYFPNVADRIPFSSTDSNIPTTEDPQWYYRRINGSGTWVAIEGRNESLSINTELMAESGTSASEVYYAIGEQNGIPEVPREESADIVNEENPIQLNSSSRRQVYTALAVAPLHNPSSFRTITINIIEDRAETPVAIPPTGLYTFPMRVSLFSNTLLPPSFQESIPIYYEITESTVYGAEPSEPSRPSSTGSSQYNGDTGIMLPITNASGDRVFAYRIRAIASDSRSFEDSETIDIVYRSF